jgi:hypothetical protein
LRLQHGQLNWLKKKCVSLIDGVPICEISVVSIQIVHYTRTHRFVP